MRRTAIAALGILVLIALAACQDSRGPAEKAGASIDKAGQNLRDTVDPPQGPAEETGRKIDRAIGN
jgi:hypothetical protein